jgi:uncharacterized protein (TIGR00369 family)
VLPDDQALELNCEGTDLCFGCGQKNPIGLRLCFDCRDGSVVTEFIPNQHHEGWPGFVHGGILFTLLDEAMGHTFYHEGRKGVTAKAEVRFKHPARIGEPLVVHGRVEARTRRLIESRATVATKDGTLVAEGKGLMYLVDETGKT